MTNRIVIVGAGLACARLIEAVRSADGAAEILAVGAETHLPYDRPPLSKSFLSSADAPDPVGTHLLSEDGAAGVRWLLGNPAVALDLDSTEVHRADGGALDFDYLVVATGTRARRLPASTEVPVLRTVDDALRLRSALWARSGHLVLIGAGFVGSEVAAAARGLGWQVTLVDPVPTPLASAVGGHVARWIWQQHRVRGVHTRFGAAVADVVPGGDSGHVVCLTDGTELGADLVVAGLGVVPNTEWLHGSGLDIVDGVLTDNSLRAVTSGGAVVENVLAVGDVARTPSPFGTGTLRVEHWSGATAHARVATAVLSGSPARHTAPPVFWTDVYEHRVQVVGIPQAGEEGQPGAGGKGFAVAFHDGEGLTATVAVNWPARMAAAHREIGRARTPA